MQFWEQIILGIFAVLILFLFWPGVRQVMERSRAVENPDWKGILPPLVTVILFVILLIFLVRVT